MPITREKRLAISGTACCLVSALAYTAVDIFMRQLTVLRCDPFWAVFNKELVTAVAIAPWLLYRAMRGRPTLPGGRTLLRLLLVGFLIQVVGNVGMQWALGVVGLAVTIPAVFGAMIAGGAVMGRAWLGEHVSLRTTAAIAILLVSLVFLGLGAETVGQSIAAGSVKGGSPIFAETQIGTVPTPLLIALGVVASGVAGMVFVVLNITIRHSVMRATTPTAVAFLVPLTGAIILGPISVARLGVPALLSTSWEQLLVMAAAGIFNLIGFLALIHGLQRTTVVHVNVLSASQVALASLAGMAMFHEPPTPWLLLGVGLTVLGIVWIDRPAEAVEEILPP